ncbi:MAG: CoA transferase subunit A, partial [Pseudomonas sp.]|nr:CoA transferase subunit A [Pseudomonas sp.]
MNKQMTAADVVGQLRDGMTIGFGGWGPRRKPMAIVREILRSDVKDLTVVAYGGPEVGMLCAAGKVRKLIFGFATLDAIPLEAHFRKAREAGELELMELDEGMLQWGLRAAGMRLPFLPTRCGLATDVSRLNPEIKQVQSPYADGEVLLAMPALNLDIAFLHVNVADRLGNTLVTGP